VEPNRDHVTEVTDFGVRDWHGTNAFIREGDQISRTYFTDGRGDEALGTTWSAWT
jgi:predicted dithiol-disulfide oxidoreductase (DUF899 family)